jgi:hypothetical protein
MLVELQQPGYLHVLINHLPIIGTFMGLIGVLVGLILRQRRALIPGLVILLIAGVSTWPVYETGEAAYKMIRKISDEAGVDWLDQHMDRADQTVWTFYLMAGLAAIAIVAPVRWPRSAVPLAIVTLLAAVGCSAVAAYIARPGGLIRHTEFRVPDTPSTPPAHHHGP